MISAKDLYTVISAVVPLYVTMFLAYGSVKWWKIFSPEQCAGINRFVAIFAVPLLSFEFIYKINPYEMNFRFIAADALSKAIVLLVLVLWCIIWYTLMLFLLEYRSAKMQLAEQSAGAANSMTSFKVESDVISLDDREFMQTDPEMGQDAKVHVNLKKSFSSVEGNSATSSQRFPSTKSFRPINHSDAYSLQSSRNLTPRDSSFNKADYVSLMSEGPAQSNSKSNSNSNSHSPSPYECDAPLSHNSSLGHTPRTSNSNEDHHYRDLNLGIRTVNTSSNCNGVISDGLKSYSTSLEPLEKGNIQRDLVHGSHRECLNGNAVNNSGGRSLYGGSNLSVSFSPNAVQLTKRIPDSRSSPKLYDEDAKELHMFVWSSSGSPVSEGGLQLLGGSDLAMGDSSRREFDNIREERATTTPANGQMGTLGPRPESGQLSEEYLQGQNFSYGNKDTMVANARSEDREGPRLSKFTSSSTAALTPRILGEADGKGNKSPHAVAMISLIINMVFRKLVRNPNSYASVVGIVWALVSYRWHLEMPQIVKGSVTILSNAGLGMAMFSLGLFMALQPKIIACGTSLAIFGMILRFLIGPAVMAVASIATGIRDSVLHIAIVQAALPQGIVPFVFAREYNLHPDVLSTAVIFGMIVSMPVTILYYVLLGL
ncbi:hypothetical protein SUGI_0258500 [Cryptomeria japonica]|nr:hypothetical protein SUGI_0258500 [Cryptomeria japonica]